MWRSNDGRQRYTESLHANLSIESTILSIPDFLKPLIGFSLLGKASGLRKVTSPRTLARKALVSAPVFHGLCLQFIMIHTIQIILIHSMYIPTNLAAADTKHWKNLNWVYFDEHQLIAYIGAVACGTG